MQANPKVSLLIVDPENTGRFLQIRGEVELVEDGALEHLDAITRKYTVPSAVLWLCFSAGKEGARDAHHLPHPREKDHAGCDTQLKKETVTF